MKLVISRPAENDIAGVYAYYHERSYDYAERAVRTIIRACDGLTTFPLQGKPGKIEGTREYIMARYPYRVVYRIDGETIVILRVVHHRQHEA